MSKTHTEEVVKQKVWKFRDMKTYLQSLNFRFNPSIDVKKAMKILENNAFEIHDSMERTEEKEVVIRIEAPEEVLQLYEEMFKGYGKELK